MVRKIIEVELEKPNCAPILIFHCSSCRKEFAIDEVYYVTGMAKLLRTGGLRTFLLFLFLIVPLKFCTVSSQTPGFHLHIPSIISLR